MQQLRKRWLPILIGILLVGGGAWYKWSGQSTVSTENTLVARVKRGDFKVTVTTTGELRARKFVQITGPGNAQMANVYQTKIATINRHHVSQLKYFLDKLAAVRDGERSLLDNSMILYGSGLGDGDRHNHDDLPVMIAGSAGGALQTGRHVRYDRDTPMTNLYLSMLDIMGAKTDTLADSTGLLGKLRS